MIDVRKSKDKYKICNSCGSEDDVKEICYGRNKNVYNVFSLCEKCQMELMEKMWGGKGEMTITVAKKKSENCCTCKHDKRIKEKDMIVCRCDIDGHYIGYFKCFERLCDNCEMYEQKARNNERLDEILKIHKAEMEDKG